MGDLDLIPELVHLLEEGMATPSSILAQRIPRDREAWWAAVHGVQRRSTAQTCLFGSCGLGTMAETTEGESTPRVGSSSGKGAET